MTEERSWKAEIEKYIMSLKSEVEQLRATLKNGANSAHINVAGKRIVLCATLIDEAIGRIDDVSGNASPVVQSD